MHVCLAGYGYWGKNLLRNLIETLSADRISVAEIMPEKRAQLKRQYPNITCYDSFEDALAQNHSAAFVIATETRYHYDHARKALLAGKHVLVEKPLTTSVAQAKELCRIAKERGLILMVDHIFRYHPVVWKMKEYFREDYLGPIHYMDATRVNLGIYQEDVNVLWDLACHDLSIIQFLVNEKPTSVRAIGRINPEHGSEDVAYLFLYYPSGMLVQINSSWASPVKIRKMIVGGEKRMMIYDDIEPTNKLTIYEYEPNIQRDENKTKLTDYRLGNIIIPKIEQGEALRNVIVEFLECIQCAKQPASDGYNALEIINILEKAQQSLSLDGAIVPLP
ncbi:MAG: Gfo/Idh/MocA family oxidoreductase [Chitinophagales bacterium]|nr:Gfo/Idh/MocA family oxidoreductase [Chitinophagales bacterium]